MRWRAGTRGKVSPRQSRLDGAGAGDRRSDQDANLQVDRKAAAIMLNVSELSVASAETVRDKATPELQAEVERRICRRRDSERRRGEETQAAGAPFSRSDAPRA
jgi:hypothetical protein